MVTQHVDVSPLHTDLDKFAHRIGHPTLFKPSQQLLAVATSHGLIVLYDTNTNRRIGILGTVTKVQNDHVQVTALDWGPKILRPTPVNKPNQIDARLLAAGYSDGTITVWNTETFQPITAMKNEFKQGSISKIISLYATNVDSDILYSFLAVSAKSSEMRQYTFPKSSNAIRTNAVPILLPENSTAGWQDIQLLQKAEGHSVFDSYHILAISTRDHIIIQMINPIVTVIRIIENPIMGSVHNSVLALTKSCIAWKGAMFSDGEYSVASRPAGDDPILAVSFAGSNRLQFYKLSIHELEDEETISVEFSSELVIHPNHFSSWIYRINWMSNQTLMIIANNNKRLMLVDRLSNSVVETVHEEIGSYIITIAETLHYFPISPISNRTFMVKHKSATLYTMNDSHLIRAYSIIDWQNRINRLYNVGFYSQALDMAVELYVNPESVPAVIGLPAIPEQRKQIIGKIISAHLTKFAEQAIGNRHMEDNPDQVYWDVGTTCLNYCMDIRNPEIIWDLFQMYCREKMEHVFITILAEECILPGKLQLFENTMYRDELERVRYNSKQMSLFKAIVGQYESQNKIEKLENIILNVNISSMKELFEFQMVIYFFSNLLIL
jgi:hypothetical protein